MLVDALPFFMNNSGLLNTIKIKLKIQEDTNILYRNFSPENHNVLKNKKVYF